MEFAYDGGGLAKGGKVTLYYDGQKVGEGRVEQTVPMMFSADETTDVGRESGTPVTPDYDRRPAPSRQGQLGADRPRQGRPRPSDQPGGTAADGHGAAVGREEEWRVAKGK